MPLQYDDIPGSWGTYSRNWPYYQCCDEAHAWRVYVACTKEKVLPYGSYVLTGLHLRVETPEMLEKLQRHMFATKVHDYKEIIRMYEDIELPLRCYDEPGVDMKMYLKAASWAKLQQRRKEERE